MTSKLRLLDLFAGGGGASTGYHLAGFEVEGVDINPQRHYPFKFHQADAFDFLAAHWQEYDVITGSPPCQDYCALSHMTTKKHLRLIAYTRAMLRATGKPYVIENVERAKRFLKEPLMLCGSMFGLQTDCGAQLRRHRFFESNVFLMSPGECRHGEVTIMVVGERAKDPGAEKRKYPEGRNRTIGVTGPGNALSGGRTITVTGNTAQQNVEKNVIRETFTVKEAQKAMGIDWLPMSGLSQAIPPAYTKFIGIQIREQLSR